MITIKQNTHLICYWRSENGDNSHPTKSNPQFPENSCTSRKVQAVIYGPFCPVSLQCLDSLLPHRFYTVAIQITDADETCVGYRSAEYCCCCLWRRGSANKSHESLRRAQIFKILKFLHEQCFLLRQKSAVLRKVSTCAGRRRDVPLQSAGCGKHDHYQQARSTDAVRSWCSRISSPTQPRRWVF